MSASTRFAASRNATGAITHILRRYDAIHGQVERLQSYLSLTAGEKVFETRGLAQNTMQRLFRKEEAPNPPERDFTAFLNDWSGIKRKLGIN